MVGLPYFFTLDTVEMGGSFYNQLFSKNIHQFVFLATIQDLMNRFCLKHIWSTKGVKGWRWRWRGLMVYQGSNSNLKLILSKFLKEHCFYTEVDVEILQTLVTVKFTPMPNQMSTATNSKSSVIHYASDHWRIWQILQEHQTSGNQYSNTSKVDHWKPLNLTLTYN